MEIIGAGNKLFDSALEIDNSDLEDSVPYVCAIEKGCEVIISKDKNFYRGDIEVLSAEAFVERFL